MEPTKEPIEMPAVSNLKKNHITIIILVIAVIIGGVFVYRNKKSTVNQPTQTDTSATSTASGTGTTTQTTQNVPASSEQSIIKKGNEVDKQIQDDVIKAFAKQKELFASGKKKEIQKYIINGTPEAERAMVTQKLSEMSDESFKKMIDLINSVMVTITPEVLRSAETKWTFNQAMTKVRVEKEIAPGQNNGVSNFTIEMVKNNGVWY